MNYAQLDTKADTSKEPRSDGSVSIAWRQYRPETVVCCENLSLKERDANRLEGSRFPMKWESDNHYEIPLTALQQHVLHLKGVVQPKWPHSERKDQCHANDGKNEQE